MNETELERLIVRIVGDTKGYTNSLKQAEDATQISADRIQIASNRVSAFGLKVRRFGAEAATALLPLVGITSSLGIAFKAVNLAAEAEKTQAAFGVMLQSVEKGAALTKSLQQFAAETPLNTGDIQRATKLLLQFGVAADDIIPTLRMLGDVTGGDAQRLMQMALAFGQAQASGRLMGQDLLQMINAGFNPLQEISRKTGRSVIELKQSMEKGQISIQMVRDAFKSATGAGGQFQNNMQTASKTLSGLFSTMQDDIDSVLRTIGTDLVDALQLKEAVKGVSSAAQTIGGWWSALNSGAKALVASLVTLTGVLITLSATWTLLGPLILGTVTNLGQVTAATIAAAASTGAYVASVFGYVTASGKQFVANTAVINSLRAYTVSAAAATTASYGLASGMGTAASAATVSAATLAHVNAQLMTLKASLSIIIGAYVAVAAVVTAAVAATAYFIHTISGGTKANREFEQALRGMETTTARSLETFQKVTETTPFRGQQQNVEALEHEVRKAQIAFDEMDTTIGKIARNIPLAGRGISAEFELARKNVDEFTKRLKIAQDGLEKTLKSKPISDQENYIKGLKRNIKSARESMEGMTDAFRETDAGQRALKDLSASISQMEARLEAANTILEDTKKHFVETKGKMVPKEFVDSIDTLNKKLEEQIATVGMSSAEVEIYRIKTRGIYTTVTNAAIAQAERNAETLKETQASHEAKKAIDSHIASMEKQLLAFDLSGDQMELLELRGKASNVELKKMEELMGKIAARTEYEKLLQRGADVTRQFLTPQQQLNDRVAELDHLLENNAITQGTYSRALADARRQLDSAERSAAGLNSQLGELSTARFGGSEFRRLMRNQALSMSFKSSSTAGGLASPKAENLLDQISRNTAEALKRVVTIAEANF